MYLLAQVVGYFEFSFSGFGNCTYKIKQHINAKMIGATFLKSRFSRLCIGN